MSHKHCTVIVSFGRPDFLKEYTWQTLIDVGDKSEKFILCSDDDASLPQYKNLYGDRVIVFNKDDVEKLPEFDLMDAYYGDNHFKCVVFARVMLQHIVKKLGYRYYIVLDDDYWRFHNRVEVRIKDGKRTLSHSFFQEGEYEEYKEKMFSLLDSVPWLNTVAMSQDGDYIGGLENGTNFFCIQNRFKAMNFFFCDTEKYVDFKGRINEDVNAYISDGMKGRISLTVAGAALTQPLTQQTSGGLTDIYLTIGTYNKSLYTVMINPSAVKVGTLKNKRFHHKVNWEYAVPKIVDSESKPLEPYISDEPKERIFPLPKLHDDEISKFF